MKRNILHTAIITILMFTSGITFAQKNLIKNADKLFDSYLYHDAIYKYEGVKNKDINVTRKLADAYRLIRDSYTSEKYYEALFSQGSYDAQDVWNYAEVLKMNKKYVEAIAKIEQYNGMKPGEKRVELHLADEEYYRELMADTGSFKVHTLPFNTAQIEYAPTYYNGEIVFCSSQPIYSFTEYNDNWTDRRFTNLFAGSDVNLKKTPNISYIKEVVIKGGLSKKFHEGPASFTRNGLTMIFTRNTLVKEKDLDTNRGRVFGLWISQLDVDGKWRRAIPLPFNNPKYNVGHPAISPDGTTLYFSSDMPGGFGGTDIYHCSMTADGVFGPAINMGDQINTEGDEMYPFFHEKGLLFFASNGHAGLGGLDIFETRIAHGKPGTISNLGGSINSSKDDFALIIDISLNKGYFSSNRDDSKGLDDIYGFTVATPFVLHKTIQGVAKDHDHGDFIAGAHVKLFDSNGKEIADTVTDEHGFYHFQAEPDEDYSLTASKEDYKEGKKKTSTRPKGEVVVVDLEMEKMHVITLECIITDENTNLGLDNVHMVILDKATSTILYDIHTDPLGKWRTVLEPALAYTTINYRISLEKEGYVEKTLDYSHRVSKEEEIKLHEFMDFSLGTIKLGVDLGKLIDLNPIYFDKGKFDIRPDAAVELDKIVNVMLKYPNIKVELDSHTDCRNSSAMNGLLSQKRADASVAYIVGHGITANRIFGIGMGESKPVNDCKCEGNSKSNCSEEEHAKNRRTEFLIVDIND